MELQALGRVGSSDAEVSPTLRFTSQDVMEALQGSIRVLTAEIDSSLGARPKAPPTRHGTQRPRHVAPQAHGSPSPLEGSSCGASSEASCSETPEYLPFRPSARTALQTFHQTNAAVSEADRRHPRRHEGAGSGKRLGQELAVTRESNRDLQGELCRVREEMSRLREECRAAAAQLAAAGTRQSHNQLSQLQQENELLKEKLLLLSSLANCSPGSSPKPADAMEPVVLMDFRSGEMYDCQTMATATSSRHGLIGGVGNRRVSAVPEVVQLNVQRPSIVSVTHLSPDDFDGFLSRRGSRPLVDLGRGSAVLQVDRPSPSTIFSSPRTPTFQSGGSSPDFPPRYGGRRLSTSSSRAAPYTFPDSNFLPAGAPSEPKVLGSAGVNCASCIEALQRGLPLTKVSSSGSCRRRWVSLVAAPWRVQWTSTQGNGASTVLDLEAIRCVAYNSLSGRPDELAHRHLRFSFLAGRKVHDFCCPTREALLVALIALHSLVCPGAPPLSVGQLLWRMALRLTNLPVGHRPIVFRRPPRPSRG
eukprot:GGOE01018308.1.p1 GENE.GGOE01018308.1~~GGOE01018308.1.p1  ORF type:complete len:531 (-),score=74.55 GGOE01018308.1:242-1834(-)